MRIRALQYFGRFAVPAFLLGFPPAVLAGDDILIVPQNVPCFQISHQELLDDDPVSATVVSNTPTSRGTLTPIKEGFVYCPDALFWDAGTDSFHYGTSGIPKSSTVFLIADPFGEADVDLEISTISSPGTLTLTEGSLSANAPFPDLREISLDVFLGPKIIVNADRPGPSGEGGKTEVCLDPSGFAPDGGEDVVLVSFSAGGGDQDVELLLRASGAEREVSATSRMTDARVLETPWAAVDPGLQTFAVAWWTESVPGAGDGGLVVASDGRLLASTTAGESAAAVVTGAAVVEFGPRDRQGNVPPGSIVVGNPRYWQSSARMELEPIFADGLESADFEAWTNVFGNPVVSAQAAVLGTYGAKIAAASPSGLIDDSPSGEARYRARFHLDLTPLGLPSGQELTVLAGRDAGGSTRLGVFLRGSGRGAFEVCAEVQPALGPPISTPCREVAGGPHLVKVQWWASQSSLDPDGGLRLWLGDDLVGQIFGLQTFGHRIEEVRLGSLDPAVGAAGSFYLDDVETWR